MNDSFFVAGRAALHLIIFHGAQAYILNAQTGYIASENAGPKAVTSRRLNISDVVRWSQEPDSWRSPYLAVPCVPELHCAGCWHKKDD